MTVQVTGASKVPVTFLDESPTFGYNPHLTLGVGRVIFYA